MQKGCDEFKNANNNLHLRLSDQATEIAKLRGYIIAQWDQQDVPPSKRAFLAVTPGYGNSAFTNTVTGRFHNEPSFGEKLDEDRAWKGLSRS